MLRHKDGNLFTEEEKNEFFKSIYSQFKNDFEDNEKLKNHFKGVDVQDGIIQFLELFLFNNKSYNIISNIVRKIQRDYDYQIEKDINLEEYNSSTYEIKIKNLIIKQSIENIKKEVLRDKRFDEKIVKKLITRSIIANSKDKDYMTLYWSFRNKFLPKIKKIKYNLKKQNFYIKNIKEVQQLRQKYTSEEYGLREKRFDSLIKYLVVEDRFKCKKNNWEMIDNMLEILLQSSKKE